METSENSVSQQNSGDVAQCFYRTLPCLRECPYISFAEEALRYKQSIEYAERHANLFERCILSVSKFFGRDIIQEHRNKRDSFIDFFKEMAVQTSGTRCPQVIKEQ